jgi:prepilin-type N-terminal cleavage/methylation domain-containing protein
VDIKKGFTLIEVMVVVCLFVVIATLGIMQVSFLDSTILHAETNKLAAVCSYLRQKAIATNAECVLTFDVGKNEYRCGEIREVLPQRVSFGFLPKALGPPGSPSHKIEKAITFPGNSIHFYPTGIISSGTVYLVDKGKQYMYALSNAVSQFSYLRLYRYDGKWKLIEV